MVVPPRNKTMPEQARAKMDKTILHSKMKGGMRLWRAADLFLNRCTVVVFIIFTSRCHNTSLLFYA
jgi:hypothetical protein